MPKARTRASLRRASARYVTTNCVESVTVPTLPAMTPTQDLSALFANWSKSGTVADVQRPDKPPAIVAPTHVGPDFAAGAETENPEPTRLTQRTKEDKRKARHDLLLAKLHLGSMHLTKNQKKRRRKKEAGAGMMAGMEKAIAAVAQSGIPAVSATDVKSKVAEKNAKNAPAKGAAVYGGVSKRGSCTRKERQKIAAQEMSRFKKILQHPAFMSNPMGTIQEHLKNTLGS